MSIKIKRILSLVTAAALLSLALLSCANKNGGGTSDETSDATERGTSAEAETSARVPETDPSESTQSDTKNDLTEPPDTDPPATEPAVTEPPVTEPPVTEPSDETTSPDENTDVKPETKTLDYVALGDSIAFGYGLSSPETERYSAIIDGYLDLLPYYECESHNYGVNGQTSAELLAMLEADSVPELHDADIVTVSIGANNVLSPAIEALTQYTLNLLIEDEAVRSAANAAAYASFLSETDAGIAQFESDLPKIIDKINEYAPDAQVIVQTVYNPYNNVALTFDFSTDILDMNKAADALVSRLNEIIGKNADALGYSAADIYGAFEGGTGYINADSFDGVDVTKLDPHPTSAGHRLIADTICTLIYTE